jgi:hypothetical protein
MCGSRRIIVRFLSKEQPNYHCPSSGGKRTPIKMRKDVGAAQTALIRMENGRPFECVAESYAAPSHSVPTYDLARGSLKPPESTKSIEMALVLDKCDICRN